MTRNADPRITFGMIVLNGEPFVRYSLRALYPFAHQIIVVEGACPSAKNVATTLGHSRDATLDVLRRFRDEEDPEGKVVLVTAEDEGRPDGFWSEKDEMSRAYASRATGNYLWQVDSDEFYLSRDMNAVVGMLRDDPSLREVSFRVLTFWGDLWCRVDGIALHRGAHDFHRLFAWGPGYRYVAHRPPTVVDERGRNLADVKPVKASRMAAKGIYMYHYELLFPKQVEEKCSYYRDAEWLGGYFSQLDHWVHSSYFSLAEPYRVHMLYQQPSWLERFSGEHPAQAVSMMEAVRAGAHPGVAARRMDDAEELLSRPGYIAGRTLLKTRAALSRWRMEVREQRRRAKRAIRRWLGLQAGRGREPAQPVSTDYRRISPEAVPGELADAWRDPAIPGAQREVVEEELKRLDRGEDVPPFRALADAVRATGCEDGEILEVGCASGYYREVLCRLLGRDIRYRGIDYSQAMVDEARKRYPGIPFSTGDATALPLGDESCDVLISGCVMLHVPDYRKVVAESARASRKWVIFHRTPVVSGPTVHYTKSAYGVRCLEIAFGEEELLSMFGAHGLEPAASFEVSREPSPDGRGIVSVRTYLCRKKE